MYSINYTGYTVQFILYRLYCTCYIVHRMLFRPYSSVLIPCMFLVWQRCFREHYDFNRHGWSHYIRAGDDHTAIFMHITAWTLKKGATCFSGKLTQTCDLHCVYTQTTNIWMHGFGLYSWQKSQYIQYQQLESKGLCHWTFGRKNVTPWRAPWPKFLNSLSQTKDIQTCICIKNKHFQIPLTKNT